MLNDFLTALAGRRMFVAYKLVPKANGKSDKIPIDPLTRNKINWQDPRNWMTSDEALATGLPIGLVITEGCGIACVDLDKAIEGDQWTPFALNIMHQFPGAAMEISASGTGGHIFFTILNAFPAHRTRRAGQGLEIYTRGRFIALTGTNMIGDVRLDFTDALSALILEFYPEVVMDRAEWTSEPYSGWRDRGLTDEQIIHWMRTKRGSPRAMFGDGITFAQLWDGDADALATAYPADSSSHDAYNASSADQALANHLAYATGYNCEHVQTLMLDYDCALKRDKWDREDYLYRTITRACEKREAAELAQQTKTAVVSSTAPLPVDHQTVALITQPGGAVTPPVPTALPPVPLPVTADGVPLAPLSSQLPTPGFGDLIDGKTAVRGGHGPGAYMHVALQQDLFRGMVLISDVNEISYPNALRKDQARFNNDFGGLTFQIAIDEKKPSKKAWEAFVESELHEFPRVESVIFDPRLPPRQVTMRDGLRILNSWAPVHVPAIEGDVSLLLNHLQKMYPYGQDKTLLICYFAAMVQSKGVKFQWAPLLQGVEGNGKTFLSQMMRYCMSERYTHNARASQIGGRFNAAFEEKLLVIIEDVKLTENREAAWEALKPMVTDTTMEIEQKGVDAIVRWVCFNFIMNSNHKDAIRKTPNDRRIANFFGAQQQKNDLVRDGMDKAYFDRLYDWAKLEGGYAAIHYFLQHYQIPDELNPALGGIAPETTSTARAIQISTGSVEQEFKEAVDSGRRGFKGGFVSSIAFDDLLAQISMSRKITRHRRVEIILEAGYILHPGLPDGRVVEDLSDSSRPCLFIRPDHATMALGADAKAIAAAFTEAQAVK